MFELGERDGRQEGEERPRRQDRRSRQERFWAEFAQRQGHDLVRCVAGSMRRVGWTVDPIELDELEDLLEQGSVQVLDVREKAERDEGYIPGTLHVPYRLLRTVGAAGIDTSKPVVTICESGTRASIAASVLTAAGVEARPVLHGGVDDWPGQTVSFRRCGST
jgi:rhodanese-related sulfurtransferase